MADPAEVGEGRTFRRGRWVEALGAVAARVVPEGAFRDRLRARYHALLAGRGGLHAVLPGGERIRIDPAYRHIGWNVAEYDAFRTAVRVGDTVLDVGANVGAYSVLFGSWVGDGGRVHAFEPATAALRGLRRHLALNGLEGVVRPVHAAVSDRTGWDSISGATAQGTARLGGTPNEGDERVRTVTIDDFCADERAAPSLIKLDVEGWELEALRGARETIRRGGDGVAVFVELHPTVWAERGMDPAELRAELALQGLEARALRPVVDPWGLEGECVRLARVR
jgi:FkbM family methyltransferase